MQGDGVAALHRSLAACGERVAIHPSTVIVEPASVRLGSDVILEPLAVLMGYPEGWLEVGDGSLIGPHAYLQGLGGLRIGERVGVGAGVRMLTAVHAETPPGAPISDAPLRYGAIDIGDGCDIGVGAILLPGTRLEPGIQVGAGALVRGEHAAGGVIAGIPAQRLRERGEGDWASRLATEPPAR